MGRTRKAPPSVPPAVLVTGAAGSVGHFLVKHLAKGGFRVIALDLPGADFPRIRGGKVRVIKGDITAPGIIEEAVMGVKAVIHAAAVVDIGATWDELAPVNYFATTKLYDAAREAGVEHFVFFSTGSVYKGGPQYQDEGSPTATANDYVRTKLMAEKYLRTSSGPTTVNIIRPALIYGPWGKVLAGALATVPYMLRLFTDHMVTLTGGPISNWVHAEDAARAAVFLVGNPQPHGQVFNVANDDPVSVGDMFSIALRAGGVALHEPRIPFPAALVRAFKPLIAHDLVLNPVNRVTSALFGLAARKAGLTSPLTPRLDKEALDFAVRNMLFDNRLLKGLGFEYRYPRFEDGWLATQDWYQRNHWVPAA
ncbi:MAG: NAD(P)-dependent oxidoreductase [Deltaproteobacteria bacterium]|nr:NAD(P)-dependent oxidoreductase [Deltaproteobacteria bacterium]